MRKTAHAASAIAVVALVAGMVVTATAGPDISSPRTITVIEKDTQSRFVDVGPGGPSLGDRFVFSAVLLRGGNVVGHDGGGCTAVHRHPAQFECEATFRLPGGMITAQTLFHPTNGPQTFAFAVNGGTGVFRNARGQGTIEQQTPIRAKITFHLIP